MLSGRGHGLTFTSSRSRAQVNVRVVDLDRGKEATGALADLSN